MATHGTLTAFDSSTTNWTSYVDQLNYYFVANDIKDDANSVLYCYQLMDNPLLLQFAVWLERTL